ncbi:MAG: hypothetical protein V4659_03945 [Pseudomonadota bacterium]
MSDPARKTAELDALIEAVEAGDATEFQFFTWRPGLTGTKKESRTMMKAYNGSLDAAKALHDALLPGWKWGAHEPKLGVFRVYVSPWSPLRPVPETAEAATTARAWLLAILRAYRAKIAAGCAA